MKLQPLEDELEIRRAFDVVRRQLIEGTRAYVRNVGYQGGTSKQTPVYWHSQEHFWVCFNPVDYPSELLGQYGVLDPAPRKSLHATVEINSPKRGINRRTAGAFVSCGDQVFLAHSGRVTITGRNVPTNGGFREFCVGVDLEIVSWPKGKTSEMFLIGRIDEVGFPQRVASFVKKVARYKEAAKNEEV